MTGGLWVILITIVLPRSAPAQHSPACTLSSEDVRWVQIALDGWERVSRQLLRLEPKPLPWMVLYDASCVWHLAADARRVLETSVANLTLTFAGEPVSARAGPHRGKVRLPNSSDIPPVGLAFGSLYEREPDDKEPFFVLALLDVWRQNVKAAKDPRLPHTMLGVFSHEVVHTWQLEAVDRRVDELKQRYAVPQTVDDDVVENRFKDVPGFREAHDSETDLFYAAASETDSARRRQLVAKALALVRARQSKYFTGPDEVYRALEELFLNMEGVAVWASFKLSQIDERFDIGVKDPVIERARNTWSQDEGLALFLLIDSMVPEWRERVLGPSLASPFALLEEAVRPPAR